MKDMLKYIVVYERYGVTHETTNSLINREVNMPLKSLEDVPTTVFNLHYCR